MAVLVMDRVMGDHSEVAVPSGVKYLLCTQFLLRFAVKGTQAVLVLFLFEHMLLSENLSTELVHIFLTIMNCGPILGAFLSDGYLGKYRALGCCLLLQLAGMVTLVSGTVPNAETRWRILVASVSGLGLLFVALGVGGGKPLVSALGGDQIEVLLPKGAERDRLRVLFFSLWYLGLNLGSLLATLAIPPLRTLGSYGLIFSLQTAVLGVCILVFWLGRSGYAQLPVEENVFAKVGAIIIDALKYSANKRARKSSTRACHSSVAGEPDQILPEPEEQQHILSESREEQHLLIGHDSMDNGLHDTTEGHSKHRWLESAKLKHGALAVDEVKVLLRVLILFTPMPVFWALFDQQYTKWVFQARSMNLELSWFGGLVLQPEQIQALNPLLVLITIPVLDKAIYPLFTKFNIPLPPLRKMVMGMVSAAVAFLASGVLQLAMDRSLKTNSPAQTARLPVIWQVPQYIFITLGEVLINVTGLEFAYSQAPSSMKSLLQGSWLFCQALGDLMTAVIIVLIGEKLSTANEFFLFAGGCAAAMLWLLWISQGYEDVQRIVPAQPDPMLAETTFIGLTV